MSIITSPEPVRAWELEIARRLIYGGISAIMRCRGTIEKEKTIIALVAQWIRA